MSGTLTLIPTPIDDETPLENTALELLQDACLNGNACFVVEEHKTGRRKWIKWGLPREEVDRFYLYNEHTANEVSAELLSLLRSGRNIYLMSDCGLPAFCDPGQLLVDQCHLNNIKVTCTSFPNSIALSVALSGYPCSPFNFEGFIPARADARQQMLKSLWEEKKMVVIMDTPYRLKKLITEISELHQKKPREIFLALDLNQKTEQLLRGPMPKVSKKIKELKREFILIFAPK